MPREVPILGVHQPLEPFEARRLPLLETTDLQTKRRESLLARRQVIFEYTDLSRLERWLSHMPADRGQCIPGCSYAGHWCCADLLPADHSSWHLIERAALIPLTFGKRTYGWSTSTVSSLTQVVARS